MHRIHPRKRLQHFTALQVNLAVTDKEHELVVPLVFVLRILYAGAWDRYETWKRGEATVDCDLGQALEGLLFVDPVAKVVADVEAESAGVFGFYVHVVSYDRPPPCVSLQVHMRHGFVVCLDAECADVAFERGREQLVKDAEPVALVRPTIRVKRSHIEDGIALLRNRCCVGRAFDLLRLLLQDLFTFFLQFSHAPHILLNKLHHANLRRQPIIVLQLVVDAE